MSNTPDVKVRVSAEDEGVSTLLKTLSKQLAQVEKDQKKVAASTTEASRAQTAFAKSGTAVLTHLKSLATAYAALRVVKFVTDQIDAADAISKLSQKTGVATETLSVLAFAGETADLSLEGLTTTIRGFAKSSGDLAKGNQQAADAFRAIGISAKDLRGLSPDQAFLKSAKALGSFGDSLEKEKVAMDIFGRRRGASSSRWPTGLRTKGSGASPRRPSAPARSSRRKLGARPKTSTTTSGCWNRRHRAPRSPSAPK
jgi:hypothetical protein